MTTAVLDTGTPLDAGSRQPPRWAVLLLAVQAVVSSIEFDLIGTPATPWVVAACIAPLFFVAARAGGLPQIMAVPSYRAATAWLLWSTASLAWSIVPVLTAGAMLAILGTWLTATWFVLTYGFQAFARVYTGAMALFLTAGFVRDVGILANAGTVHRFAGFGLHPNNLAHAALFTMLLSIVLIVEFRKRTRWTWWSLSISTLALAATGSRTAIIAAFVALSMMASRRLGLARTAMIGLGFAAAIVAVISLVPEPSQIVTRDENTRDLSSVNGRSAIWPVAVRATLESPIAGHGVSASELIFSQANRRGELTLSNITTAHNMLLEISLTTGIVGLALFLLMLASYAITRPASRAGLTGTVVMAMLIAGTTEAVLSWRSSSFLVLGALITERALSARRRGVPDHI